MTMRQRRRRATRRQALAFDLDALARDVIRSVVERLGRRIARHFIARNEALLRLMTMTEAAA